jgi:hypothetical protein
MELQDPDDKRKTKIYPPGGSGEINQKSEEGKP